MRKILLTLFLCCSAMAVDVPSFQSVVVIDPALLVPDSAPPGTYTAGGVTNDGRFECRLDGGPALILMNITSANNATAELGLHNNNGFPAFQPDNHFGLRYTAASGVGTTDTLTFEYTDTIFTTGSTRNVVATKTLTVNIVNTAPAIIVSASPSLNAAGFETAFFAVASDPDSHAVSVSYDYGDGQTGTSATHVYAAPGVYTVTATANDGFGGTSTAQTTVTVVGTDHIPTARFTTSDVVAFVNVPFVFDATTSTDPQNGALIYAWSFGDNTPNGAQAIQPHVYTQTGALTVALTITDAEGFTSTITREIEVLEESAAATFDSEVQVETTYFPLRTNKDTLSIFARVNIGDTQLVDGSAVALEYAGKRYTANLNKRGKAVGWTVKQNLRRQAPGTVEVRFKVRNTAIASLLSQLGAVNDADIDVPFRLELGAKTIQIDVPTLFEVGVARGKGVGELD